MVRFLFISLLVLILVILLCCIGAAIILRNKSEKITETIMETQNLNKQKEEKINEKVIQKEERKKNKEAVLQQNNQIRGNPRSSSVSEPHPWYKGLPGNDTSAK